MTMLQAVLLAIVEGLTEYLPVSSTGHIILTSWLMGIESHEFVKDYTVMVQFGAILAVLVLYWRRFLLNLRIYPTVFIAFLPAAVVGLLVKKKIDALLESVAVVGVALLVGGVILVATDHWLKHHRVRTPSPDQLTRPQAFKIGLFQLLAFIPGVSRSAATILGGIHQGMSLVAATEFSFFLAAPTLTGASFIKLLKVWPTLTPEQGQQILVGNVISFFVGAAAIHSFVFLISRFGLKSWGYYRIVLGLLVLLFV